MTIAAGSLLALCMVHVLFTFVGEKFHPRDAGLREAMQQGHPVITRQTTLWRTWIGFNASHGQGAILFGLVYGFRAQRAPSLLFGSMFLRLTGLAMISSYLVLAWLLVQGTAARDLGGDGVLRRRLRHKCALSRVCFAAPAEDRLWISAGL
jgi:hypothetical protein